MRHFLAGLVILLVIGLLLVWGLNQLYDSATRQSYAEAARAEAYGRAEAMVIHAQAESRLSAAQAAATTSSAMLPWGVLGVLGLLGLVVVALAFALIFAPAFRQPAAVARPAAVVKGTGRHSSLPAPIIIYLTEPDLPRRVVWQALSATKQPLLIEQSQTGRD
jgi:hypothetical protein